MAKLCVEALVLGRLSHVSLHLHRPLKGPSVDCDPSLSKALTNIHDTRSEEHLPTHLFWATLCQQRDTAGWAPCAW